MESDPLLGLTTLLVLLALWGYFHWFGTRALGDESHRSSLLAASLGTVLTTSLIVTVGDHPAAYMAAVVPWMMVAMFAYKDAVGMAIGVGMGAWALWWSFLAFAGWFAGIRDTTISPF